MKRLNIRALASTAIATFLLLLNGPFALAMESEHTDNCFQFKQGHSDLEVIGLAVNPTIDETTRDAIFNVFRNIYRPKFAAMNLDFDLVEDITPKFGALAERNGGLALIHVNQGTRYHQRLSPDMYAMILCHELGHHLGGAPRFPNSWASAEGEADYFATLKCWKTVESGLPPLATDDPVDDDFMKIQSHCREAYPQTAARLTCQHSLGTALRLSRVMAGLAGFPATDITTDADSKVKVAKTFVSTNEPLCRWETFRSGALCVAEPEVDIEAVNGACSERFHIEAVRPSCWFHGSH